MGEFVQEPKFEVFVSGYYSCSIEEWLRSRRIPASELPPLTASQKEFSLRFGLPEQEYARHLLANSYGRDRIVRRAQELGGMVERMLGKLGNGYRLLAIKADLSDGPRVLRLQTEQGITEVDVPPELAASLLRREGLEDEKKLRNLLLSHLSGGELIGKKLRK